MPPTPYYSRAGVTIFCGDCLEVMPRLDPYFDAIIADWPYGTTACEWDSIIPLEPLWKECKRIIGRLGAIVLFGSQPFTSRLVLSNLKWFKYEWILDKQYSTNFLQAKKQPLKRHENIIVFSENGHIYNPQMIIGKYRNKSPNRTKGEVYRLVKHTRNNYNNQYYPTSILEYNHADHVNRNHPTEKSLKLLRYLTVTYSNPGEIILDNTMGSGTTLVAAQAENRRAVGIDISEEYCQIAVERLRSEKTYILPNKQKAVQTSLLKD